MGKTRLLLLLVFVMFGATGAFLWKKEFYELAILLPPVPMVSSLLLFVFSFFEVERTATGELYFKQSNPYLRLMRYVFGGFSNSLEVGQISICKLHGFSLLLVIVGIATMLWLFTFGVVIFAALNGGMAAFSLEKIWYSLAVFGSAIGVITALVLMGTSEQNWLRKLGTFLSIVICGGIGLSIFVVWPILSVIKYYNVTFLWAIVYYLGFVLLIAGAIAAVVFLVWTAIKFIQAFKETWLGQIFLSVKGNFCPMILLEVPTETEK